MGINPFEVQMISELKSEHTYAPMTTRRSHWNTMHLRCSVGVLSDTGGRKTSKLRATLPAKAITQQVEHFLQLRQRPIRMASGRNFDLKTGKLKVADWNPYLTRQKRWSEEGDRTAGKSGENRPKISCSSDWRNGQWRRRAGAGRQG
ncbi:unnamed protein product [Prunus brigantina]